MRYRTIFAVCVLILSTLACGQYVGTPTPEVTPAAPAASPTVPATLAPTAAQPTGTPAADVATVRAALVNVRAKPGGEVVGQLIAGTDVRVIGCRESWCEVETDELSGYVFQGCLSIADGQGCEAK